MLSNIIERGNYVYFVLNHKQYHIEKDLFYELNLHKNQKSRTQESLYLNIDGSNYYITNYETDKQVNKYFRNSSLDDLQTEFCSKNRVIVSFDTKDGYRRIYSGVFESYLENKDMYLFLTDNQEYKTVILSNIKMVYRFDNQYLYEL